MDNKEKISNKNRKYNYIYEELVKDDNDLTGMIAYSLYKSEKIKYLKKLSESGHEISDRDINNFHTASKIRIKDYEEKSLNLFTDFIDDIIDRKVKMSNEMIKEVVENTASPKGLINWARAITQSVIGAVIYTLIVSIILFFVWFKNSGQEEKTKNKIIKESKELLHIPKYK